MADADELDRWIEHLDALGIDRSPPLDEPYGTGVAFKDPDGIALELFLPARRQR